MSGTWNWPDDHFPDGSWNRNIDPSAPDPAENLGRAGYLYEYCTNQLTIGWSPNPARGYTSASFSLSLFVENPDPAPEPNIDDYLDLEEYLEAYNEWLAASGPLYSADLTGSVSVGGDSQYTFTIPAEALAYGSRLKISVSVSPGPIVAGGMIPAEDIRSLTCDSAGTGTGGSDLETDGSGSDPDGSSSGSTALASTGSDVPWLPFGLSVAILATGAALLTVRSRKRA